MVLKVKVSPALIEELLTIGHRHRAGIVVRGIPEGSKLVNVQWQGIRDLDWVELLFETKGFVGQIQEQEVEVKEEG